jgi:hypothetical protein
MTAVEPAEGLQLALPDEPEGLRLELRDAALAAGDWRAGPGQDDRLGAWLWEQWAPALGPAGFERAAFLAVVRTYGREVWFWLLGDRQWAPMVEGLAGRVARRLPAG